jgi:hypothetical protein
MLVREAPWPKLPKVIVLSVVNPDHCGSPINPVFVLSPAMGRPGRFWNVSRGLLKRGNPSGLLNGRSRTPRDY